MWWSYVILLRNFKSRASQQHPVGWNSFDQDFAATSGSEFWLAWTHEPGLFFYVKGWPLCLTFFLFSWRCTGFNLVWHTQGKQTAVSSSSRSPPAAPKAFYSTRTAHKLAHRNLCMIAQSHINTVSLALCASTTAHDSLCQFALQPKRKPFPVVPGWSEAARPGVLCSHSLSRGSWTSWAESPRLLYAVPTSDFVTPWPTLAAPLPRLFNDIFLAATQPQTPLTPPHFFRRL